MLTMPCPVRQQSERFNFRETTSLTCIASSTRLLMPCIYRQLTTMPRMTRWTDAARGVVPEAARASGRCPRPGSVVTVSA